MDNVKVGDPAGYRVESLHTGEIMGGVMERTVEVWLVAICMAIQNHVQGGRRFGPAVVVLTVANGRNK